MCKYDDAMERMNERFGKDSLISIATRNGRHLSVRMVDGYYENGAFYIVTYTKSNKMKQIKACSKVVLCGACFNAHGVGENLGHVRDERHTAIMAKLREAFASWYDNGHVNEDDPNTCLLRIRLTDGVLANEEKFYTIDFINRKAREFG